MADFRFWNVLYETEWLISFLSNDRREQAICSINYVYKKKNSCFLYSQVNSSFFTFTSEWFQSLLQNAFRGLVKDHGLDFKEIFIHNCSFYKGWKEHLVSLPTHSHCVIVWFSNKRLGANSSEEHIKPLLVWLTWSTVIAVRNANQYNITIGKANTTQFFCRFFLLFFKT